MSGLVEVVHEHLAHLVHGDGGIDGALETQLPHQIGEGAQVISIRMTQQDGVYSMQVSAERESPPTPVK